MMEYLKQGPKQDILINKNRMSAICTKFTDNPALCLPQKVVSFHEFIKIKEMELEI